MKGMPIYCIMQVIPCIDGDDKDDYNDSHQHLLKNYYLPGSLMIYIHYVLKTSLQLVILLFLTDEMGIIIPSLF